MKLFLSLFFLFNISVITCQTLISGTIYHDKTKEPLEGVSVYFDGTTIGTISNTKGYFELEIKQRINSPLVISMLGFTDLLINDPYNKGKWEILLSEKAIALEGVVLKADPFTRAEKLRAFKAQFLGSSINGRSCTILNEDAIWLSFDVTTNRLLASIDEPIIIRNEYLGYENRFKLVDFFAEYNRRTLSSSAVKESYYAGTSFFIDKQKKKRKYLKRRNDTYQGSVLHLMRTLRDEDYEQQKFQFFKGGLRIKPRSYINVIKQEYNTKVVLPDFKMPILFKNRRSDLTKRGKYIIIDHYGNFAPPTMVYFNGDLGMQRVGDMLPLNFKPKK